MTKKKKIALAVVIITVIFGACFACVAVYAKKVINTPKFEVPEAVPLASKVEIPDNLDGRTAYITSLYNDVFNSETEVKKYNEYNFDYDSIVSDLSDSDLSVIKYALRGINDVIGESYDSYDYTSAEGKKGSFALENSAITLCDITEGQTDDNGNVTDDGYYFFNMEVNAEYASEGTSDTFGLSRIDGILQNLSKTLEGTCKIKSSDCTVTALTIDGKADRVRNQLKKIRLCRSWEITIGLEFTGAYEALGAQTITLVYNAADVYEFSWYGAYFTEQALYMNPGDMESVPVSVTTNADATKDDYSLSFTVSDDSAIEVDEDGIITALRAVDSPITLKAEFTYRGVTYTDTILVTVTELEVEE